MRRSSFENLPPLVLETETGAVEVTDYPEIARAYAQAVADGDVPGCMLLIAACKRYLRMLDMAKAPGNLFTYSPAHVVDYCAFLEKLKHVESGMWEINQINDDGTVNPFIILEPWQIWIESAIQGFRKAVTGVRLVNTVFEFVPRKNAKSLRVAGAALFDLCCSGQLSPQITLAASTKEQANRVFSPISKFISSDAELRDYYSLNVTDDSITTPHCGEYDGIFKLSGIGHRQDGFNPSLAIFEEGHAGASDVYKVVDSAFGARPNALRRMITTAGYRPEGPAWELFKDAQRILEGGSEDYTFFAAIYTLDEEDYRHPESKAIMWDRLFTDETLLRKANPMYGVGLDVDLIKKAAQDAKRRPDLRGEYARTRFNIWTTSGSSLIEYQAWMSCKREGLDLSDFFGQKCWIGVDLASTLDMCAIGIVFEIPDPLMPEFPTLAVFARYFIPAGSPTATDEDLADQFMIWEEQGYLTMTEGAMADHDRVREEIQTYCNLFQVQIIACDPYQGHNTSKQLWDENRPVRIYPNNAMTMTAPTDDLLSRIVAGKLLHDGNPVLAWNAANVYGERKGNGSIIPRKEDDKSKRKIDGFVALCFANGCRMQPEQSKDAVKKDKAWVDPYLNRGIINEAVR